MISCLFNPGLSWDFLTLRAAKNNSEFLQSTSSMLLLAFPDTWGAPPSLSTFHPHSSHPPWSPVFPHWVVPLKLASFSFPLGKGFGCDSFVNSMWFRAGCQYLTIRRLWLLVLIFVLRTYSGASCDHNYQVINNPCGHKIIPLLLFLGTPSRSTLPSNTLFHCSKTISVFFLLNDSPLVYFLPSSLLFICYSVCFMYLHKLISILTDYKWQKE